MYSPKRRFRLFRAFGPAISDSTVYFYSWSQQASSPNQRHYMLNTDDTGRNVASVRAVTTDGAEGPYISADGGATWSYRATGMTFGGSSYSTGCCFARSSPSTLYASVFVGYLYKSTDGGATWTELTSAGSRNWSSIQCSSTGKYVIATVHVGFIYISTDGGTTWTEATSGGSRAWDQGIVSEDGTKFAAIAFSNYVYVSTNGGSTWTPNTSFGTKNYRGLSASADGSVLFAAAVGLNRPALSTDTGSSWTTVSSIGTTGDWWHTAASINGNKLVTAQSGGYIFVSQDRGATWAVETIPGVAAWEGLAITPDGKTIFAGINGGKVWVATGT